MDAWKNARDAAVRDFGGAHLEPLQVPWGCRLEELPLPGSVSSREGREREPLRKHEEERERDRES